jgi:Flp pilus assembly pilin Flp
VPNYHQRKEAVTGGSRKPWIVVMWRQQAVHHLKERLKMTFLKSFWQEEQGQDLIEYTLLMAFVALASAALFLGAGGSIKGIWTTSNSQLAAANTQAS